MLKGPVSCGKFLSFHADMNEDLLRYTYFATVLIYLSPLQMIWNTRTNSWKRKWQVNIHKDSKYLKIG